MTEINGLGPFDIKSLTMAMVADVVVKQRAPMVVSEVNSVGHTDYAVMANSNVKIVCPGCFKEGMTLMDTSRCRMCSSFVKHTNTTKEGARRMKCAPTPVQVNAVADMYEGYKVKINSAGSVTGIPDDVLLQEVARRGLDSVPGVTLLSDDVITAEVERRQLTKEVVRTADTDVLIDVIAKRSRGLLLRDARTPALIHELRRLECGNIYEEDYYHNPKKRGRAHASDEIKVHIFQKTEDITRSLITRATSNFEWAERVEVGPMALVSRPKSNQNAIV
jgi:hypothetical protein